ncbi:MAG: hypothetical protein R3264_12955 [Anaerolineae bacterium]|nr:hypothetical protein [Anaerolineae bacterium]
MLTYRIQTFAYRSAGQGFKFTFPEPDVLRHFPWYGEVLGLISPFMRIDHIFVSQHFVVREAHIVTDGLGSDHRPVVATLYYVEEQ